MIQKKIVLAGMLIMFGFCGSMDSVASASNLSKAEVVVEKNEVRNIGKNIQADGNGVLVKSGGKAVISGNIKAKDCGIRAESSAITVYGNIKGGSSGVHLYQGVEADIYGNIEADEISIDYTDLDYYREYGEWRTYYGEGLAVVSDGSSSSKNEVNVKGNIRATGTGVRVNSGNVFIKGNIESLIGNNALTLLTEELTSVKVEGDIFGNEKDSAVFMWSEPNAKLIVEGNITARDCQSAIEIYGLSGEMDSLREMPAITVKTLNVESGDYFKALTHDENGEEIESKALAEVAAKATWYIVDISQPTNGEIEVDGISTKEGLLVAHEGDKLTVTGAPKKGYRLTGIDAGSKALVTENEDGTYTVTVERGGDVTISASFEAMPEMPLTGDQIPIKTAIFLAVVSITLLGMLWKTKRA